MERRTESHRESGRRGVVKAIERKRVNMLER